MFSEIVEAESCDVPLAPDKSSLTIISTGLNAYRVFGFEQCVIPWLL